MKILKIPFSEGSLGHNKGCKEAPDEIIRLFNDIWTNENMEETPFTSSLEISEVDVKDEKDITEAHEKIYDAVKKFGLGLYLGGDHSITYPCFKAFSENFKNPGIIIFDAHPDCYSEHDNVTHQDWLKFLIDQGIVKGENVIIMALRNPDMTEVAFLKSKGAKFYPAKNIFMNYEDVCEAVMEIAHEWDGLYISIDIDALDPAFAPGTGYKEPGGLSTRELLYFIQRLKKLKNLKAFDIVEINPEKDNDEVTVKTGAKIMGELL